MTAIFPLPSFFPEADFLFDIPPLVFLRYRSTVVSSAERINLSQRSTRNNGSRFRQRSAPHFRR